MQGTKRAHGCEVSEGTPQIGFEVLRCFVSNFDASLESALRNDLLVRQRRRF